MPTPQQKLALVNKFKSSPSTALLAMLEMLRAEAIATIKAEMEREMSKMPEKFLLKHVESIRGERGEDGCEGKEGRPGPRGERGMKGDAGNDGKDGKDGAMGPVGPMGPAGREGLQGPAGKDGASDAGADIVKKINELPITPDKQIDASHIKNLPRMGKRGKKSIVRGNSSEIYPYDLSDLLDGVTKVFTIPTNRRVLGVWASSFPGALRPTIDYTYTTNTLTFTDEITADATLASGQTVWLQYVEA